MCAIVSMYLEKIKPSTFDPDQTNMNFNNSKKTENRVTFRLGPDPEIQIQTRPRDQAKLKGH